MIFRALTLFALAQSLSETSGPWLHGKVFDAAGKPVSGAIVALKKIDAAQPLFTIASANGAYSFRPLDLGVDYELRADREGLASRTRTLRVSNTDEIATIDLTVRGQIRFEDVAEKAGLHFVTRNGARGRFYQPEIMLGGVAALDYNNDGCMDIFVTNGATLPAMDKSSPEYWNRLYRNNCDMTFTDVTETAGLRGSGYSMGVAAADFNNDGFVDLFVTGLGGNLLYRNRGDGTFVEVAAKVGLTGAKFSAMWPVSAGWFDYDNDGYLDLFVTNYVSWTPETDSACNLNGVPFYCHPRVYRGLPNQLFHNNGDGTFTDVSRASGIGESIGKGMGVAFGDFDGDGLMDVFVANDSVPNFLFQNLGKGEFKEVALASGTAYNAPGNAVAGMGVDFRDFDDDGRDDIALDAMYFDGFTLYRNGGKPHFFTDATVSSGLALATRELTGWGMGMFDFDNDGYKDLFFATSHFPGSESSVHSEASIPNHVLRNSGIGRFEDVSLSAGPDFQRAALNHGAAFADFDNDGRIDVVVTAVNGQLKLFRNISPEAGHWVAIRLIGTRSNRDGLGAKVRLTLPTGRIERNHATTAVGYASSSEPIVRFGLGPYESVRDIEIRWPGGSVQKLTDPKIDKLLTVREE